MAERGRGREKTHLLQLGLLVLLNELPQLGTLLDDRRLGTEDLESRTELLNLLGSHANVFRSRGRLLGLLLGSLSDLQDGQSQYCEGNIAGGTETYLALRKHSISLTLLSELLRLLLRLKLLRLLTLALLLSLLLETTSLSLLRFLLLLVLDELFLLLENLETLLVGGGVGGNFEFGFVDL
jgi:hypothetical protein